WAAVAFADVLLPGDLERLLPGLDDFGRAAVALDAKPLRPIVGAGTRGDQEQAGNGKNSSHGEPRFLMLRRSEERRVGKECRFDCDWSSDVCSSDLGPPWPSPTSCFQATLSGSFQALTTSVVPPSRLMPSHCGQSSARVHVAIRNKLATGRILRMVNLDF